jgi:hypothetical protein
MCCNTLSTVLAVDLTYAAFTKLNVAPDRLCLSSSSLWLSFAATAAALMTVVLAFAVATPPPPPLGTRMGNPSDAEPRPPSARW